MSGFSLRRFSLVVLAAVLALPALGQYNVVNTSSNVNCVFTSAVPCTNYVTDYVATFMGGNARLQSRINQATSTSTAANKWVYRYRIDLTQVAGVTYIPWADYLAIYRTGPLRQYDLNFDSVSTDQVFNVTSGGLGSKAVTQAWLGSDNFSYFYLGNPVYGGDYPGDGESSYFFGFVSDYPPVLRTVWVHIDTGWVSMTGYAPDYP